MKNSPINSFFGQAGLLSAFDDAVSSVVDSSVDSYKYRTTISEKEDSYCVTAQVPGLSKEDIKISVDGQSLHVLGEKEINEHMTCSIDKTFQIGRNVDCNKITASVLNGILEINVPKSSKFKTKNIKIT
jgi:HSP20 family protein